MKIDADEKELLGSVERGEWKSAGGGKRERSRYSRYAKATFRKDRRLNIRLSSKDLEAIQKRALAEGLPYQTLIASLLHEYATGRLKEGLKSRVSVAKRGNLARLTSRQLNAMVRRQPCASISAATRLRASTRISRTGLLEAISRSVQGNRRLLSMVARIAITTIEQVATIAAAFNS